MQAVIWDNTKSRCMHADLRTTFVWEGPLRIFFFMCRFVCQFVGFARGAAMMIGIVTFKQACLQSVISSSFVLVF
jgi:hypothetical protein